MAGVQHAISYHKLSINEIMHARATYQHAENCLQKLQLITIAAEGHHNN